MASERAASPKPLVRPPPSIPPAQGSGDIAAVGRVSEAPATPEPALGSVIYWKRIGHRVGSGIFPSSPCFGGSQVGGIADACRDGRRYFALGMMEPEIRLRWIEDRADGGGGGEAGRRRRKREAPSFDRRFSQRWQGVLRQKADACAAASPREDAPFSAAAKEPPAVRQL